MTPRSPQTTPRRRLFRLFARDRKGSAAVQFALIAPLFIGVLFAIMETSMVFFAEQALETGARDVSRLVMTGQIKSGDVTQADFKKKVCDGASTMFKCDNVYVDVQSYSSSSTPSISSAPVDACSADSFAKTSNYSPGDAGDTVVIRVFYSWQLYLTSPSLYFGAVNGSGQNCGKRLLSVTAAFRNEPF